jgi:hypothetical protein
VAVDGEARGEGGLPGQSIAAFELAAHDIESDGVGDAPPYRDPAKHYIVIIGGQCHSSFIQHS